jgi:predicted nucleic-acid-binding Zn-ribbon protein
MLNGTLQDWLDAHITGICITCESCGHHPLVPVWVLVSRLGPSATYEQIEAAMKCSKCGCKGVTAERMKEPDSALIWNKLEGA